MGDNKIVEEYEREKARDKKKREDCKLFDV